MLALAILVVGRNARADVAGPKVEVTPLESVPYGYAYLTGAGGKIERLRAYPTFARDMHAYVAPDAAKIADAGWSREAWRITLWNEGKKKVVVLGLDLVRTSYEPLPERYVCVWGPKGHKDPKNVEVELKKDRERVALLGDGATIDLAPEETQVVVAKVTSAEPGIYRMRVVVEYRDERGAKKTRRLDDELALLVPDRNARRGVHLRHFAGNYPDVAARMLRLSPKHYDGIAAESSKDSWDLKMAPEKELGGVLKDRDDDNFVKTVRQWKDLLIQAPSPDEPHRVTLAEGAMDLPVGTTKALFLLASPETMPEGVRVLEEYRVGAPEDDVAVEQLMGALVELRRLDDAERLWKEVQHQAAAGTPGYYVSGLLLAMATKDGRLARDLSTKSRHRYPENLELLNLRLNWLRSNSDWPTAIDEIRRACRFFDDQTANDKNRFVSASWRLLDDLRNVPVPGVRGPIERLVTECPADVRWAVRSNPMLWTIAPSLRIRPDVIVAEKRGPQEQAALATALGRSGRPGLARAVLEHGGASAGSDRTLLELLGDVRLETGDLVGASQILSSLAAQPDLPRDQRERVLGKQLLVGVERKDFRELVGLYLRYGAIPPPWQTGPIARVPTRVEALLRVAYGYMVDDPNLMNEIMRWKDGDPSELVGGYTISATQLFADFANDLGAARRELKNRPRGLARLPTSLGRLLRAEYIRLRDVELPFGFTTVDQEWKAGGSPYVQAKLMHAVGDGTVGNGEAAIKPFFVRTRGGLWAGVDFKQKPLVFAGFQKVPLDAFTREHAAEGTGAAASVYLTPESGPRFDAEMELHDARAVGFGDYDLEKGTKMLDHVLALDPKNVEAWEYRAAFAAASGQHSICLDAVERGLKLDPEIVFLKAMQLACQESKTATTGSSHRPQAL